MGNNADGHELLAAVAAVHHERVGETLDDGALSLAETLGGVTASGVREVDGRTDLDVVAVRRPKSAIPSLHSTKFVLLFPPCCVAHFHHCNPPLSSFAFALTEFDHPKTSLDTQRTRKQLGSTYVKEMSLISTSS